MNLDHFGKLTDKMDSPDKHLSSQQMESLRQAFILFDRDRDGHISKQELARVGVINKIQFGIYKIKIWFRVQGLAAE